MLFLSVSQSRYKALFSGTKFYDMKLLPASSQLQGLILVKVDEKSFFRYEQEEED